MTIITPAALFSYDVFNFRRFSSHDAVPKYPFKAKTTNHIAIIMIKFMIDLTRASVLYKVAKTVTDAPTIKAIVKILSCASYGKFEQFKKNIIKDITYSKTPPTNLIYHLFRFIFS